MGIISDFRDLKELYKELDQIIHYGERVLGNVKYNPNLYKIKLQIMTNKETELRRGLFVEPNIIKVNPKMFSENPEYTKQVRGSKEWVLAHEFGELIFNHYSKLSDLEKKARVHTYNLLHQKIIPSARNLLEIDFKKIADLTNGGYRMVKRVGFPKSHMQKYEYDKNQGWRKVEDGPFWNALWFLDFEGKESVEWLYTELEKGSDSIREIGEGRSKLFVIDKGGNEKEGMSLERTTYSAKDDNDGKPYIRLYVGPHIEGISEILYNYRFDSFKDAINVMPQEIREITKKDIQNIELFRNLNKSVELLRVYREGFCESFALSYLLNRGLDIEMGYLLDFEALDSPLLKTFYGKQVLYDSSLKFFSSIVEHKPEDAHKLLKQALSKELYDKFFISLVNHKRKLSDIDIDE